MNLEEYRKNYVFYLDAYIQENPGKSEKGFLSQEAFSWLLRSRGGFDRSDISTVFDKDALEISDFLSEREKRLGNRRFSEEYSFYLKCREYKSLFEKLLAPARQEGCLSEPFEIDKLREAAFYGLPAFDLTFRDFQLFKQQGLDFDSSFDLLIKTCHKREIDMFSRQSVRAYYNTFASLIADHDKLIDFLAHRTALDEIAENKEIGEYPAQLSENLQTKRLSQIENVVKNHFMFLEEWDKRKSGKRMAEEDIDRLIFYVASYFETDCTIPLNINPIRKVNTNKNYILYTFRLLFIELRPGMPRSKNYPRFIKRLFFEYRNDLEKSIKGSTGKKPFDYPGINK